MPTLSRRQFLRQVKFLPPAPTPSAAALDARESDAEWTLSGNLTPYNGPWTRAQAAHLLRRVTFGARKDQVDQLLNAGSAGAAVDLVLDLPANLPPPPVNNYNTADYTDPQVPAGLPWVNAAPNFDNGTEGFRIESWRGWWLERMINAEANIQEKMTLFWHNHFATQASAVFIGRPNYLYNQRLREYALGNFKDLVKAVTLEPMMLYYLNGFLNEKTAPDENYARELQELFTIGKDNPDHYTEDDVVAAARVLTGWRVNFFNSAVYFDPNAHDTGDKQFSAFYNQTIIQGSADGDAELDALLDMIFDKEEVALFICRKLYRFFVYYKIDAAIEQNIIVPLAQILRDEQYEIRPVVETLLKSEHFFQAVNKGCYIKNPLDLVVGALRNFNLGIPASTPLDQWQMQLYLNYTANVMQMLPGEPPNVAGWAAYRHAPGYYRNWISGDTIRNRNIYTDVLSFYYYETDNDRMAIDHVAFAAQFDHPEDPNLLLDDMLALLLPVEISFLKKLLLKTGILLSGQANDYYWTNAWNTYVNNPSDQMAYETVRSRLALLHKYITSLAEYQLA